MYLHEQRKEMLIDVVIVALEGKNNTKLKLECTENSYSAQEYSMTFNCSRVWL
jgi:hypothetical protein